MLSKQTQSSRNGSPDHPPLSLSQLFLSPDPALPSYVTFPPRIHDHLSLPNSDIWCSIPYTPCHILVSVQHSSSSLHDLFGLESTAMSGNGPRHVCHVSVRRFTDTLSNHCLPSAVLTLVLTMFTSTLLDHCRHRRDVTISSPVLTSTLGGRRPFPSLTSPRTLLLGRSSQAGSPALALPPRFPLIVAVSLSLICGGNSCSC